MDLLQHNAMVSVEDIAARIAAVHAERMRLLPDEGIKRKYDVEAAKMVLQDIQFGWEHSDNRSRRVHLLQLIDRILVDTGGVCIDWAFM